MTETGVVSATRAALEVIRHLEAAHGPLEFFISGACCDGTTPMCLTRGELPPSPHDERIGRIGDAPVYIDGEQYERWRRPQFKIDVAAGPADGFSLEGSTGVHFVARSQ